MAEQSADELRNILLEHIEQALSESVHPQSANLLKLQQDLEENFAIDQNLNREWLAILSQKFQSAPPPWNISDPGYIEALKELRASLLSGKLDQVLEKIVPNTISPDIRKRQILAYEEAKAAKQAYENKWKNWYENYKKQLLQKFYSGLPAEEQTRPGDKSEALIQFTNRVIGTCRAETKDAAGKNLPKPKIDEMYSRNKVALRAYAVGLGLPPSIVDDKPEFLNTMRILEGIPQDDLLTVPAEQNISRVSEVATMYSTEITHKLLPEELGGITLSPEKRARIGEYLATALFDAELDNKNTDSHEQITPEFMSQLENAVALLSDSPLSPLQKARLLAWAWDVTPARKIFGLPDSKRLANIITFPSKSIVRSLEKAVPVPVLTGVREFFLNLPGGIGGFFGGIFNSLFSVFNGRPAGALATGLTTAGNQLLPGLFSLAQNAGLRQRQASFAAAILKGTAETFFGKYKYYILGAVLIFFFLFLTSSTFLTESAALLPPPGSTQYTPGDRPGSVPGIYSDNIASGTCPIDGGSIRVGSYNGSTGHGSSAYWGYPPPGGYPIPIISMYPSGCEDTNCPYYGFALDVEYPGGAIGPVRVPFVCPTGESCPDQDVSWTVVAKWFNCGGGDVPSETACNGGLWGWGAILTSNANGHSWRIYLNHIDRELSIGDVFSSSTNNVIGGLYQGDMANPHVHVEINMDGVPLRPEFLCSG